MSYLVTVKTASVRVTYPAIGNPFDLHAAAVEKFGLCIISVMARK